VLVPTQPRFGTIYLLAGNHDLEDLTESAAKTLVFIASSGVDWLSGIMPMLGPAWSTQDFATRLVVAYNYCTPNSLARYFWLVLSQQDLNVACLTMPESTVGEGDPLFPSLALCLAYTMGRTCMDLEGWRSVLQRMVSLDGLKILFEHGCTSPMLTYLGLGLRRFDFDISMAGLSHGRLTCKLRSWAHELQLAGQDLQAYGRWEQELLSNMYRGIFWYPNKWDEEWSVTIRLMNFEFGPCPQDWQIWFSTSMYESTGEFWEAAEDEEPALDIPGAWPHLGLEGQYPWNYPWLGAWDALSRHKKSKRRRRRFLRYLGLGLEDEFGVFGPHIEDDIRYHVNDGKKTKALRRQYYLGNNITPPCREFVS
jgi:hypothetical protein